MSAKPINILDEIIASFSTKSTLSSIITNCDAWECHSIDRIAFALDLWKEFRMGETECIKAKSDFIFVLSVFLKPFQLKHIIKDLLHVQDKHCNEKDLKYLNNGLAIPLCFDKHCNTEQQFRNKIDSYKYYDGNHEMSNAELEENEIINHIAMLHLYFSHKNASEYLNEMKSQNNEHTLSIINNQQRKPCTDDNDERFKLILKSQNINTFSLLFHNVMRKLKYKNVQTLCDILLSIFGPKIDSIHLGIPSNLQKHPIRQQVMIFKGVLLPNEPHHTQKVFCDEYCINHRQCLSMKRVMYIMERYNEMKHGICGNNTSDVDDDSDFDPDAVEDDQEDSNHIICQQTIEEIMLYSGYSITMFVNDYNLIKDNHLLKNIKSWEWVKKELKSCKYDGKHCYIVQRHCRDRDKYDHNAKERRQLYDNKCESEEVVPLQIFDEVHHFLLHWDYKAYVFPQLNKQVKPDVEEEEMKKVSTKDTQSKPKSISERKRESRFTTTFLPNDSFVFGDLFYHWKYYKDEKTYIAPNKYRYKNLKHEMLNNKLYSIGLYLWNDALTKSIIHKYSNHGRKLNSRDCGDYNFDKSVPMNLPIPISHLMVILLYTNYDDPQREFKRKGMRNDLTCVDEELINNHLEISHFYKLFSETVLFYGKHMTEKDVLYHGMSTDDLFFTSFHPQFNVPISTTPWPEVAKKFFGNKGMLLVLKDDKSIHDRYFDCWCSDHWKEKECLFAQAHHVFIFDIRFKTDIGLSPSIAEYIKSMTLFQDILEKRYFSCSMQKFKKYESIIVQLIQVINSGITPPKIHPYIIKSFDRSYKHFKTKQIQIIQSEYNELDDITKATMERSFHFNQESEHVFVKEFEWEIPKSTIKVGQEQFIASEDEEYDRKFTFCMYIKIYEVGQITVGVWIKNILLENKQVHVEWGFKCHETKFAVSQRSKYFTPDTSHAYKAFLVSELNALFPSLKALHFTFYLKLLPK